MFNKDLNLAFLLPRHVDIPFALERQNSTGPYFLRSLLSYGLRPDPTNPLFPTHKPLFHLKYFIPCMIWNPWINIILGQITPCNAGVLAARAKNLWLQLRIDTDIQLSVQCARAAGVLTSFYSPVLHSFRITTQLNLGEMIS